MMKLKSSFLISQIATAMIAVINNSAELDCTSWPPIQEEDGTFSCDALIDCKLYLKGYECFNISKVTVRFDIIFDKCQFVDKAKAYKWNQKDFIAYGGSCSHNLTFENDEGEIVPSYGSGGFLEAFDEPSDEYITETIINTVFERLEANSDSLNRYLKDVLRAYNQSRQKTNAKSLVAA